MTQDQEIPVEFTGRHDQLTERMKEHAVQKVSRLSRYHPRISRVQIVAEHAHESPEVEMIVHVDRGNTFVAKEQADSFGSAVDQLTEKMERQLKRDNEKRHDHHRGVSPKGAAPGDADDGEETYEDVVRRDLRS